ncbi:MAG: protein kinase [Verrucomicrobiota bacterium]
MNGLVSTIIECPECSATIDVSQTEIGATIECPVCGHVFQVSKTFGDYQLEELVGEGGMGSVYRATDLNLNRTVALKLLKEELSSDEKFISNFLREVEITASLTHPNIVQVYSFGELGGQYYLVMEFIGHSTLDDAIIEQGRLPEDRVLDTAIGIATGLNFALHQGNLIHRDIKPGNLLFGPNETPKVVDFGLAITPETADHDEEIWGTPYYVSPERLEGIPEDFRSDMYSLGVSLYHALAGRPPFDANTAELVAAKHLSDKPLPLKTMTPYLSDHTVYTVMKAMNRKPEERYQSYEELIEQLEDAKRRLQQQNSGVIPEAPSLSVESTEDNSKAIIIGVSIAGGVCLLGLIAYLLTVFL